MLFSIIGCLIFASTGYDFYLTVTKSNDSSRKGPFPTTEDDQKSKGLGRKLLLSFSAYTNGKNLLKTDNSGVGHLDCLNGIRFLGMTWVVMGHSFESGVSMAIRNPLKMLQNFFGAGGFAFEAIMNSLPSVDTFFRHSF